MLVAPSWGPEGMIESGVGESVVGYLLRRQCRVTLRPHPQTLRFAKHKDGAISTQHEKNPLFSYESDVVGQDSSHDSHAMVSDWSGVPLDVNGSVKPRINGEQRVAEATTCRVERQGVASRQAALRLLRCAPALRVTRRNPLTQLAFMAGSKLPAMKAPLCENTASRKSTPISCVRHISALLGRHQHWNICSLSGRLYCSWTCQ